MSSDPCASASELGTVAALLGGAALLSDTVSILTFQAGNAIPVPQGKLILYGISATTKLAAQASYFAAGSFATLAGTLALKHNCFEPEPDSPVPDNPNDNSPITESPPPLPGTIEGFDAWWNARFGTPGLTVGFGIATERCISVKTCVENVCSTRLQCAFAPLVLDLDGDGLEWNGVDNLVEVDLDHDGYLERSAWVGADDGLLVYDADLSGTVNAENELSFLTYVPGAQSDLEGLVHFDTNSDDKLTSTDSAFSKFRVWRDLDGDGVSDAGELFTMSALGITEINLIGQAANTYEDGVAIFNTGTFKYSDGTSRSFADAALLQDNGYKVLHSDSAGEVREFEGGRKLLTRMSSAALSFDTATGSFGGHSGITDVIGGLGDDTLTGGIRDNLLIGGDGSDYLSGGDGNDVLVADLADFSRGVHGGAGYDSLIVATDQAVSINPNTHGVEAVTTGGGNDTIDHSGSYDVLLFGGNGADTLKGGSCSPPKTNASPSSPCGRTPTRTAGRRRASWCPSSTRGSMRSA